MNNVKLKYTISLWMPVFLWAGIIFYLSGIPHLKTPFGIWDLILRKIAHIVEYGILSVLVFRAMRGSGSFSWKTLLKLSLIISIGYAVSDEFHQSFVAGRHGSIIDVLIDSFGAGISLMLLRVQRITALLSRLKIMAVFMAAVLLSGCGPNYHFALATVYEKRNLLAQANHHYQKVIDRYPVRAAEAMFRIGENFRKDNAGLEARRIYKKIIQKYPGSVWADKSMESIMNSPDYFPFIDNFLWVEGDSQSGGQNMKVYSSCNVLKNKTRIKRSYYAGKNLVKELSATRFFEKKDYELREYVSAKKDAPYAVLIKYPVETGLSWKTRRDGQVYNFKIVDTDASVKVRAGRFLHCLKISEQNVQLKTSVKYVYYAPDIGRILTTVKRVGGGKESRNSELISYRLKKAKPKAKTKKK